ncbi:MAG: competence/damage-inducible protein A [Hyphomicrobiales bacterium]
MKANIISIGDELLIGQVVNTNAAWMGKELTKAGIEINKTLTISDTKEAIINTLQASKSEVDIILITGGLGPTKDDITKQTLCELFNSKLVLNSDALDNIERIFSGRNLPLTDLNKQQAYIPDKAKYIENIYGTAPGMWIEEDNKIFISMPGVPYEMKSVMEKHIIPKLKEKFDLGFIIHKTVMTHGIGESFLSEIIEDWEDSLSGNMSLAYLPQPGMVRLRITARGTDKEKLEKLIDHKINQLYDLIPQYIFGQDEDKLQNVIGELLKSNKQTIATAESCTGGFIAHLITSTAGSSAYYKGSVIAYSNEIKNKLLNVSADDLDKHGAVSEKVAIAMANGVRKAINTDFAIATTGIAGPDGGSEEKPVGTVWIAIASPKKTIAKCFSFGRNRESNIKRTANASLNMIRTILQ